MTFLLVSCPLMKMHIVDMIIISKCASRQLNN